MTYSSQTPTLELLPLRAALPAGQNSELTVLLRVHPAPAPSGNGARPPLNLSFVIDRSGSMSGQPIEMARRAAQAAIRLMQPHDRVSVVAFDDSIDTVIAPQHVTDPETLCRAVERVTDRGSTNLYGGWLEGAMLTAQHLDPQALNRVLILSDGQANAGETRADVIAQHVRGLTARGVSTSTVGLGRDYDETLLQAMADAGDGNYEHIENEEGLPAFFSAELQGLTRTTGQTVSLGVEPNPALGSLRCDVLNDLPRNSYGRWQLPNLKAGQPLDVVLTLHVPAQGAAPATGVTRVRLAWNDRQGVRQTLRAQLTLPVLDADSYAALPDDPRVTLAAERLRAARVREQAVAYAAAGDIRMSRAALTRESRRLSALHLHGLQSDVDELLSLDQDFATDEILARKRAASQSYNVRRSKPEL